MGGGPLPARSSLRRAANPVPRLPPRRHVALSAPLSRDETPRRWKAVEGAKGARRGRGGARRTKGRWGRKGTRARANGQRTAAATGPVPLDVNRRLDTPGRGAQLQRSDGGGGGAAAGPGTEARTRAGPGRGDDATRGPPGETPRRRVAVEAPAGDRGPAAVEGARSGPVAAARPVPSADAPRSPGAAARATDAPKDGDLPPEAVPLSRAYVPRSRPAPVPPLVSPEMGFHCGRRSGGRTRVKGSHMFHLSVSLFPLLAVYSNLEGETRPVIPVLGTGVRSSSIRDGSSPPSCTRGLCSLDEQYQLFGLAPPRPSFPSPQSLHSRAHREVSSTL